MVMILTLTGVEFAGLVASSDGNLISVPSGRYSVVEECSALDFLIGAAMISLVFGALMYNGAVKRAALVLAALIVAILANGFRTTTVILITHYSAGEIDLAQDHGAYGWIVFFVATVALMWWGYRFRDPLDDGPHGPSVRGQTPATTPRLLAAVVVIAGAAPAYVAFSTPAVTNSLTACLPTSSGPWRSQAALSDWRPIIPGATGRSHRGYAHGGQILDLYIAYFGHQEQGAELVGWAVRIADGKTWSRMAAGTADVGIGGQTVRVAATRLGAALRDFLETPLSLGKILEMPVTDAALCRARQTSPNPDGKQPF